MGCGCSNKKRTVKSTKKIKNTTLLQSGRVTSVYDQKNAQGRKSHKYGT